MLLSIKTIRYHILPWVVFLFFVFLNAPFIDSYFIKKNFIALATLILVFYANVFAVFPKFSTKNGAVKLIVGVLTVIFSGVILRQLSGSILLSESFSFESFKVQLSMNLLFTGVSLIYWAGNQIRYKRQYWQNLLRELKEQLLRKKLNPPVINNVITPERNHFFVKTGVRNKLVKIDFSQIQYIESQGNYVIFYLVSDRIKTLASLKSIEAEISGDKFIRIHSSFIISKSIISGIEGNMINTSHRNLPIGVKYKKAVLTYIDKNTLR